MAPDRSRREWLRTYTAASLRSLRRSPAATYGHEVLARSIEAVGCAVGRGGEVDEFAAKVRPPVRFQCPLCHMKRSIALRHELDPLVGARTGEVRVAVVEGKPETVASK